MPRLRSFALFAAIILSLCLLVLWRTSSQTGGLRRVTNTTEEGININPSLSGDGRRIAFESTEDVAHAGGTDHFRAIRADVVSDPPVFLQYAGTRAPAPGISQDGSRIAFAAKEDPLGSNLDGNSEIFLYDGTTLRQITNTTPNDISTRTRDGNFQPSLTDDGRFIAFSSNRNLAGQNGDGNLEIFIFDTTSNSFSQLTNTTGAVGASDAKISGDGTRIAYIRDNNALPAVQRDLVLQDRTGGSTRLLAAGVTNLAMTYGRAISDDGQRVVYSGDIATDSSQVFLFDGRVSNTTRQITALGVRTTEVPLHPTISGDGTRIAFATRRPIAAAGPNSDNSIEVYTYDIPTGQFARVTSAPSTADGFSGSTRLMEVVSSLNDDGSVVAFNFPRVLSGAVTSGFENNSEIYVTGTAPRPTVGSLSVVNGASLGNEPATTEAVAPDSYAAAIGGALASSTEQAHKQPNGTFPTTVAGTTVTVNGRSAQIFYVSPTLVYFLVPPQTELGTATVIVTNSEGFRSQGTVPVLRAAPGLFTRSGDGTGEGVILNAQTEQPGPFDPSDGNLRLVIFATGVRNATTVTATAAGRALTVESFVASADMPGFDEIRVRVPADLRGTGTVNLVVRADGRDSNPVTVVFTGTARNDIVINEVLADPPDGIAGDANGDGVRDSSDDEFVEIVNNAGDIDISGYQLLTRSTSGTSDVVRFTFPSGTLVPAGSAIVVFGGGNPNPANPAFGGAQIFKTTGGLSLTNSGGVVTLRDASQGIVNIFSYGGSTALNGDNNQSLTRSPDITGAFVQHTQATGAGGRLFSPGTRVDGSPFASGAGRLTSITISPPSANVTVGQATQFTAQTRDQFGRAMTSPVITFASDNTTVATVDSVTKDPATGIATATVTGRSQGSARITATATDGGTTVSSSQSTINVFPPPPVANRVDVSPPNATINRGNTQQFSATAFQPNNQPVPNAIFTWSSSNTNVATIDQNGLATGVGIGTVTITASTSDGAGGTISGTATLIVQVPVLINEINADVANDNLATPAIEGDANRDGVRDSDDDEFVELFNNSTASVDLSGVVITDSTNAATSRFTLPANTILASGRALVVFGGGSPPVNDPAFGGALILAVPGSGTLSLNDTGDTVTLKLSVGGADVIIASQAYGSVGNPAAPSDQSLTRSPDAEVGTTGGGFVAHSSVANAAGRTFSPGTRLDGTPFGSPGITRIDVTPGSATVSIGGAQLYTARAFSNVGGPEIEVLNVSFIWDSSDSTKATVAPATGRTTTATGVAAGTPTIRARAGGQLGSASLTVNAPPPTLTINDVSLNEGNGGPTTFTFTVSLSSAAPVGGVTFDIATADVTAQDGNPLGEDNDYVARSLTGQTIPAGQTTYTFDVTVNGDVNIEPNETFVVNVTNVSGATIGDGQGQGTIQNDDSASLAINDVSLTEGDSGTKTFTFTVSLTQPAPAGGVSFDIATADGTATTANNDYVARSLTGQSIAPGQSSYTFDVTVNGDTAVEANETFFVNVSNVVGAAVNDGQGQGTIQNDDTALVVISQLYGGGGNSGATYTHDFIELFNRGTIPVDLTGWTVQYTSSAGTTWQATSLSGTLLPGQYYLVQEASNAAVGSPLPTPDSTGTIVMAATAGKVALVNTTGLLSGACPSSGSIIDLVGYGSGANCFEGSGPAPAPSATAADVRANGGCTDTNNNASDFAASAPTPRNTSTPVNNCSFPTLSINDVSVSEGNSGTVTASFTVSLSAPAPAGGVTFNIATQDGTATVADNDYVARSLTNQTIAAGNQSYTFDVTVNGDTVIEPSETFLVNVTNISGANTADSQGLGTIQNDDSPPDLTINNVTANETNAGTTTFTFTVSLSSVAQAGGVTFDIATQDDTAVAGSDYVARSLT
ncbi:MAG: uncharacterized protein QOJ64_3682, partial [Acidobacteriota bacterium]|nr:uncharacterized protein [Acidobacteriota bacterium]